MPLGGSAGLARQHCCWDRCSGEPFDRLSGRLGPREPFPFGPFIALGIWLVWLTGPQWWWSTWVMLLGA